MSGIYGLISCNSIDTQHDTDISRIGGWNRAYGIEQEVHKMQSAFLGCSQDHLNMSLSKSSPVLKNGKEIAVIDALLYNRDEIIAGSSFSDDGSISDEELLYDYIKRNGYEALRSVNGDFSGAIYDSSDNSVVLFRDHMGVRPLFYYACDDKLIFSSDIRGILSVSWVDASFNEDWICSILQGSFFEGTTGTEYKNIFCLTPGSFMKVSFENGTISIFARTYWEIGRKKIKLISDKAYQKRLRELIEDSIKRRLNAISGQVGAELSGGLDSGVIDILIKRLGRDCVYYSWSSSPEELEIAENDERLIIQDICEQEKIKCGYDNTSTGADSVVAANTSKVIDHIDYDEVPALRYAYPAYINTLTISFTSEYMSKQGVCAVFSGHGGDEGVSHRCNPYEMFHNHEYYHYFRYMYSTTNGYDNRIKLALKRIKYNLGPVRKAFNTPFSGDLQTTGIINKEFAARHKDSEKPLMYFAFDPVQYIRHGGSRNRLDNVALLGAYSGVRYLVPYLDFRVVDFAVSIPRYQYLRGRKDRYIFREAFKDIMPDSLYRLRTKEDFSKRSIKADTNWFESFSASKKLVYEKLDKNLWKDYLDMDAVREWAQRGETKGEEKDRDSNNLLCLSLLLMAQNVIDKSRK